MKLSVIIPVYNEISTIEIIINKILNINIKSKEIIIVDDFSYDGTREKLQLFKKNKEIKVVLHEKNLGKGACIKSASNYLSGDYVVIQDADLEYDPNDLISFVNFAEKNKAKVIYGSRVLGRTKLIFDFFVLSRIFGNFLITKISNLINNQNLTDAHTCYKFISKDIFEKLKLEQNDFSICPEITTKISKLKIAIYEIPISYNGRNYSQGKKIKSKDAFLALSTLFKYRFFN